jgi:hypothetical protein
VEGIAATFVNTDTEWRYSSHLLKEWHSTSITIGIHFEGILGTAWFDDIVVRESSSCPKDCNLNGECMYLFYKKFCKC